MRIVVLYYWLMESLTAVEPLLKQAPDLLDFISHDCFPKVATWLTHKASTPLAGLLTCIFDTLSDVLSKPEPTPIQEADLVLEYNHTKRVAVIYELPHGQSGGTEGRR